MYQFREAAVAATVEKLRSSEKDILEMPLSYENCRVNAGCRPPGSGVSAGRVRAQLGIARGLKSGGRGIKPLVACEHMGFESGQH